MQLEYQKSLARVIFLNQQLLTILDNISDQGATCFEDENKIKSLSEELKQAKNNLLDVKEKYHLEGGLSFLEDSNFMGFSIMNNHLVGSIPDAVTLALKWIERNDNVDSFKFEVASFIFSLLSFVKEEKK